MTKKNGRTAALGETLPEDALPGGHPDVQRGDQFRTADKINAVDMTYDDIELIREAIDLAIVGQFAPKKYRRGRLAGLVIVLSSGPGNPGRIEIADPLPNSETVDLEPAPHIYGYDDDLPVLGLRDEAHGNMLYRANGLGQLLDLDVESAAVFRRNGGVE